MKIFFLFFTVKKHSLTGFKIDIKSETQAREAGDFEYYQESDDEEGEDSMEDALAGVELDEEPKTEEISEETSTEEEEALKKQ